jgi:hypothetical protein
MCFLPTYVRLMTCLRTGPHILPHKHRRLARDSKNAMELQKLPAMLSTLWRQWKGKWKEEAGLPWAVLLHLSNREAPQMQDRQPLRPQLSIPMPSTLTMMSRVGLLLFVTCQVLAGRSLHLISTIPGLKSK